MTTLAKNTKLEVIDQIRKLCSMCRATEDLKIETGYLDYTQTDRTGRILFVPTEKESRITTLCLHWEGQSIDFGIRQSIEGDSNYGVLCDAMKAIQTMI